MNIQLPSGQAKVQPKAVLSKAEQAKDLLKGLNPEELDSLKKEVFASSQDTSEPLLDAKTLTSMAIAGAGPTAGGALLGSFMGVAEAPMVGMALFGTMAAGAVGLVYAGLYGSELPQKLMSDDPELAKKLTPFSAIGGGIAGAALAGGGTGLLLAAMLSAGPGGGALVGAGTGLVLGAGAGYLMAQSS